MLNKKQSKQNKKKQNKNKNNSFVRPYGSAVIPLKDHINKLLNNLGEEMLFEPDTAPIVTPKDEAKFADLIFDLIEQNKNAYNIAPLSIGIVHGLILYGEKIDNEYEIRTLTCGYANNCELEIPIDIIILITKYISNSMTSSILTEIERLQMDARYDLNRHILYVKIDEYHINMRRKRSHANACIKMQLRDKTYKTIQQAIMVGAGPMAIPMDETQSVIYHAGCDPVIRETYRVMIPTDIKKIEDLHLYFTCWDVPTRNKKLDERGFGFINLYHDKLQQLLTNNQYEIELYRNDKNSRCNYLDNNDNLRPERKTIKLELRLCSNKIYANIDIHRCLTWRYHKPEALIQCFKRVTRQPVSSIMIILNEIMNVVFTVMVETDNMDLIDACYGVICTLSGDLQKKLNSMYAKRYDEWIQNEFKHRNVWRILLEKLLGLFQWMISEEALLGQRKDAAIELKRNSAVMVRQIQKSLRGIKCILQFIRHSYQIDIEEAKKSDDDEKITAEYDENINLLFDTLCTMMTKTEPRCIAGCQSFATRNFVEILEVLNVSSNELAQNMTKFINSCHEERIYNSVELLLLTERFLKHTKPERIDILTILLPAICKKLHYHLDGRQSLDQQVMGCKLIEKCTPFLHERDTIKPSEELYDEFVLLLLKMFAILDEIRNNDLTDMCTATRIFGKTITKNKKIFNGELMRDTTNISEDQLSIHCECFVAISELSHAISIDNNHIEKAIKTLRRESEKSATNVIESVLKCCNNIIAASTAPAKWIIIRMEEIKLALSMFLFLGDILQCDYLSNSFDIGWKEWLTLGMNLLSNKDVTLENMDQKRASIIRDNYGDIRIIVTRKLKAIWNELPTYHILMLKSNIISGTIQASTVTLQETQQFMMDTYFQVIKAEYEHSNNIKDIKRYTIDQIDQLISKHSINNKEINLYLDFFRIGIRNKVKDSNPILQQLCYSFISDIETLYNYLIQLKKIPNDAQQYEDEYTSAILKLLKYFDSSGKHELYKRYLYRLGMIHQSLSNHVEAGLCFKYHSDRLSWSDIILPKESILGLPSIVEWKRHANILELAHRHFLLGEAWEMAVRICQDLAYGYEHEIFDLKALSLILQKQSQLWKFIDNHDRVFKSCYLVTFRGIFPNQYGDNVDNKSFVYRSGNGKHPESVRDFTDRIKKKYKDAILRNSSDPIPDKYNDEKFDGQFIQITTLKSSSKEELNENSEGIHMLVYRYILEQEKIMDLSYNIPNPIKYLIYCFYPRDYGDGKWKYEDTKMPLRLKKYYKENELTVFYYTNCLRKVRKRKKNRNENEFRNLWIQKTFVVTKDSIPSISRRVSVIKTSSITITPLQTAINYIKERTNDLKMFMQKLKHDLRNSINNIAMILNGILDAAVMGGIAKYREAFFDGTYLTQYPQEMNNAYIFTNALKEQYCVTKQAMDLYEKHAVEALMPHVDHLKSCYKRMMIDVQGLYKDIQNITQS